LSTEEWTMLIWIWPILFSIQRRSHLCACMASSLIGSSYKRGPRSRVTFEELCRWAKKGYKRKRDGCEYWLPNRLDPLCPEVSLMYTPNLRSSFPGKTSIYISN
jgi:hypothetical protein